MRLKNHESPRSQGRNSKSKLAPAKLRALKKRNQALLSKLKGGAA